MKYSEYLIIISVICNGLLALFCFGIALSFCLGYPGVILGIVAGTTFCFNCIDCHEVDK